MMQLAVDTGACGYVSSTRNDAPVTQDLGQSLAPTPSGSRPATWFVVATYSQAERRADLHLRQQGYKTYLPLVAVRRRDRVVRTMWHTVEEPLFPGYAFVQFDPEHDPWRPIINTPGVYALLQTAGKPHPCRAGVVEAIQAGEAVRRIPAAPHPIDRPVGSSWRLTEGALRGTDVLVLERRGNFLRCAVLLGTGMATITVRPASLVPRD